MSIQLPFRPLNRRHKLKIIGEKSMFVNLNIRRKDSAVKLGMLEIGRNKPSGASDGRFYEWRGANGTSDGGFWRWSNAAIYLNVFTMELFSNATKEKIATVENADWGMSEPVEPIFKVGANGLLIYLPPTGRAFQAFWEKV
jgi:hypothetical protein